MQIALLAEASTHAVTSAGIPVWLDLVAVVVGAISGILVAQDRKLDLVGHIALSMVCGLGGGLTRDVIMQVGDVYMLSSPYAIAVTVVTGIAGFLFPSLARSAPALLEWVDIISVGLFAAAGADKALIYGLRPAACILMGVLTGVGGGMLRDVLLGDTPRIFKRSNYYALCALAGSCVYLLAMLCLAFPRGWGAIACTVVTVLLRRLSLRFNIVSHVDIDLTPAVKRAGLRIVRRVQPSRGSRGSASAARPGRAGADEAGSEAAHGAEGAAQGGDPGEGRPGS
jgi:uncharacterized membrane protein YeiH